LDHQPLRNKRGKPLKNGEKHMTVHCFDALSGRNPGVATEDIERDR
jgi:hypothetical protein